MIRAGPVGPQYLGGDTTWDEKGRNVISHIFVYFDTIIKSVQFGYLDNGSLVLSQLFGKSARSLRVVKLNHDECITGLSGVSGHGVIRNLTFHTNRGKHGPIGYVDKGSSRGLSKIEIDGAITDRCEFGGFFGTQNSLNLTSIGMYLNPIPSSSHTDTVVKREKS